ncbi:MAG: DUF883 domain-containing protein [Burkholderiales bacterium]|nr:DUF883 domain-containing protein [Burkholderiales bacterium]
MDTVTVSRDKLVGDVKSVIADAEELLKATASDASERVKSLRPRLEESVRNARQRLSEAEHAVREKASAAGAAAERYAHENPWRIAGIAAAIGVLVGLVIGRRS